MARKQFLLRIDQALWEDLEAWAADELRSVNGQIEYILREVVRKRKGRMVPHYEPELDVRVPLAYAATDAGPEAAGAEETAGRAGQDAPARPGPGRPSTKA